MRVVLLVATTIILVGCASKSSDVAPMYVSPFQYQNYTCDQLRQEGQRVSAAAARAAGVQDDKRSSDQIATTVGVILFWPALFAIDGDSQSTAQLARLRGEKEAIEKAAIQKNCGFQFKQPQS